MGSNNDVVMSACVSICTTLLGLITIFLLYITLTSSQWLTVNMDPKLLENMISVYLPSHDVTMFYDVTKYGMSINYGMQTMSVTLALTSHKYHNVVTLEGAFLIGGVSIFIIGEFLLMTSNIMTNGEDITLSSPVCKFMASSSSVFLRIGAGILLAGIVTFTINNVKKLDLNRNHNQFMLETVEKIQKVLHLPNFKQTVVKNDAVVATFILLPVHFGWCFYLTWTASLLALVTGILSWMIAEQMVRIVAD